MTPFTLHRKVNRHTRSLLVDTGLKKKKKTLIGTEREREPYTTFPTDKPMGRSIRKPNY